MSTELYENENQTVALTRFGKGKIRGGGVAYQITQGNEQGYVQILLSDLLHMAAMAANEAELPGSVEDALRNKAREVAEQEAANGEHV